MELAQSPYSPSPSPMLFQVNKESISSSSASVTSVSMSSHSSLLAFFDKPATRSARAMELAQSHPLFPFSSPLPSGPSAQLLVLQEPSPARPTPLRVSLCLSLCLCVLGLVLWEGSEDPFVASQAPLGLPP